jgi:hypothetical protein
MSELMCCICRGPIDVDPLSGWAGGHSAYPVMDGRCCTECNDLAVTPLRFRRVGVSFGPRYPQAAAKKAKDNA